MCAPSYDILDAGLEITAQRHADTSPPSSVAARSIRTDHRDDSYPASADSPPTERPGVPAIGRWLGIPRSPGHTIRKTSRLIVAPRTWRKRSHAAYLGVVARWHVASKRAQDHEMSAPAVRPTAGIREEVAGATPDDETAGCECSAEQRYRTTRRQKLSNTRFVARASA